MSGISSLNVKCGGLVGSGKFVLLNGSVSSKNCTLHANVAMIHPYTSILEMSVQQQKSIDRLKNPLDQTQCKSVRNPGTLRPTAMSSVSV